MTPIVTAWQQMFRKRLARPIPAIFAESFEWPIYIMFEMSRPIANTIAKLAGSATFPISINKFQKDS